jgi:hypothetical protein
MLSKNGGQKIRLFAQRCGAAKRRILSMYFRLAALCTLAVSILPAQTYTFLGSVSGATPSYPNGIIQATDGNFYGTTLAGGADGKAWFSKQLRPER